MIAHLSGILLSKQATSAIVDVGGVGYEVSIPLSTFYELGEAGSAVQLRIYTHVREDAIQLFGFKTARERELFLQLISVNGVGPSLAIKLLSGMSADEMIASIRTNNLVRLVAIPGVGRKTAERLVVDLRETFDARGVVRREGSLREWTNGNLHALLEPTANGDRLRLRTVKGDARAWISGGFVTLGIAAVIATAGLIGAANPHYLTWAGEIAILAAGQFAIGAIRLPGWARLRRRQMEEVAARIAVVASSQPTPELKNKN